DVEGVRRGHHDDVGTELPDELRLALGLSAGHRYHRTAESLSPVMRAQAAGEEAITVGDVHDLPRTASGSADRAGNQVCPGVDVVLRVADHRGSTGSAARGMKAHHLLPRHGEEAKGIVVAEVLLQEEREA